MAIRGGPDISENGLVLYLDAGNIKSYPGSGTTWRDLSGTGISGSLINGPVFIGDNGGSIVFDGVNDYVAIPSFTFSSDFSVSFWEYITAVTIDNKQAVIGNASTGDDINHYLGKIRMYNSAVSPFGEDAIISPTTTLSNTWYNYTFTRSGTAYSIYLNGTLNTTATYQVFSWDVSAIGSGNAGKFTGRIPIVMFYNRALTAEEVRQNFNATRSRFWI